MKLNSSWEKWMERIYYLGTWCSYPFLLLLLVCKLFRAETLFALTFSTACELMGALILAKVSGTTVKQINALLFTSCQIIQYPKNSNLFSSMVYVE